MLAQGPSPAFFAAAPVRDQAKRIYWEDLKEMIPRMLLSRKPSETDLTLTLINGAKIVVVGMDRPERIEGTPWNGGILDEYANMKEMAWMANIRPALADRNGWCWLIGVPEGRNHYYETYKRAKGVNNIKNGGEWDAFTWFSKDILLESEIEAAKRDLDELTFQQEYEASFVNFQGQCYYPFVDDTHTANLSNAYRATGDLAFCFDFNVDPGIAVIAQEVELPSIPKTVGLQIGDKVLFEGQQLTKPGYGTGVLGEVYIPRNSNTPAVCRKLIADWGDHKGRIMVYGDATGGARGTAQTEGSDWDIVKNLLYAHYAENQVVMCVPPSNPTERSRVNAMNSRLQTADGEIHMMVDPVRAPNTVKDLEGVRLLEGGGGEIDKKIDPKLTHLTDGLGYYVERNFPIRGTTFVTEELKL
jgi:hypothetical protein